MASRVLRGMRDLRSMHTVTRRSGPTEGPMAYVDMLRLMTEKTRLERELTMWQANVQRIQARLADIETQMQQLDEITARDRAKRDSATPEDAVQEMTLTY
jgi:predicted nuclease with TOPRIM domain